MGLHLNDWERPVILAHRGSRIAEGYPENSLPAFQEAVQLGADGFELDLRMTKDNQLVVMHDGNLQRLTGVNVRTESLPSEQIMEFSLVDRDRNKISQIPFLYQVFEFFSSKVIYNIEIKKRNWFYGKFITVLQQMIGDFNLQPQVWLSSFDPVFLWQWSRTKSGIPAGFLFHQWRRRERFIARQTFIDVLHPAVSLLDSVDELSVIAKPLCFWTVNRENDLRAMKRLLVKGVISDDVPMACSILIS